MPRLIIVEAGPIPASRGVVRWRLIDLRLIDLAQWAWDEFEIAISTQTLSRELTTGDTRVPRGLFSQAMPEIGIVSGRRTRHGPGSRR